MVDFSAPPPTPHFWHLLGVCGFDKLMLIILWLLWLLLENYMIATKTFHNKYRCICRCVKKYSSMYSISSTLMMRDRRWYESSVHYSCFWGSRLHHTCLSSSAAGAQASFSRFQSGMLFHSLTAEKYRKIKKDSIWTKNKPLIMSSSKGFETQPTVQRIEYYCQVNSCIQSNFYW